MIRNKLLYVFLGFAILTLIFCSGCSEKSPADSETETQKNKEAQAIETVLEELNQIFRSELFSEAENHKDDFDKFLSLSIQALDEAVDRIDKQNISQCPYDFMNAYRNLGNNFRQLKTVMGELKSYRNQIGLLDMVFGNVESELKRFLSRIDNLGNELAKNSLFMCDIADKYGVNTSKLRKSIKKFIE